MHKKRKMGFLEIIMLSEKVGTWSTSSLIPRREDIIPRWSQLLAPVLNKSNIRSWEGIRLCCLNTLVQRYDTKVT